MVNQLKVTKMKRKKNTEGDKIPLWSSKLNFFYQNSLELQLNCSLCAYCILRNTCIRVLTYA